MRSAASDSDVELEVPADAPLLVIYTAAIIDRPNGSMLTHRNLLSMGMATARITGADHTSVFLNSGPLFHIGNFQFEAVPVFLHGGTNIFVRRVDAAEVLQTSSPTSARPRPSSCRRRSCEIKELNREAQTGPLEPAGRVRSLPCGATRCRRTPPCGEPSRAASARPRCRDWPS